MSFCDRYRTDSFYEQLNTFRDKQGGRGSYISNGYRDVWFSAFSCFLIDRRKANSTSFVMQMKPESYSQKSRWTERDNRRSTGEVLPVKYVFRSDENVHRLCQAS